MSDLKGKRAIVTGASAGIGWSTAEALAAEGVDVALAARREHRLEELATTLESEYGVDALAIPTDVSEEEQVVSMVEETVDAFGGLDITVNNAGTIGDLTGPIDTIPTEEFREVMGVNVDGTYFTVRETLPHLRETTGNLIIVGSFRGQFPRPGKTVYAASKWWTRGFALSVAAMVGPEDVAVTMVNPSEVRTELGDDPMHKERFEPGTVTEPETIADAIVYAASQSPPDTIFELDLFRRGKFEFFQ